MKNAPFNIDAEEAEIETFILEAMFAQLLNS